jgi:hypothetical protein
VVRYNQHGFPLVAGRRAAGGPGREPAASRPRAGREREKNKPAAPQNAREINAFFSVLLKAHHVKQTDAGVCVKNVVCRYSHPGERRQPPRPLSALEGPAWCQCCADE